jgi:hypothetical protein
MNVKNVLHKVACYFYFIFKGRSVKLKTQT